MPASHSTIDHALDLVLFYISDLDAFSAKEILLLACYLSPGPTFANGLEAARAAGFGGKTRSLSVQASVTLSKAGRRGLFAALRCASGLSMADVLRSLAAGLCARKKHVSTKRNGEVVVTDVGDDHATQRATIELLLKHGFITASVGQQSAGMVDPGEHNAAAAGDHAAHASDDGHEGARNQGEDCMSSVPADARVKAIVDGFHAAKYWQVHELASLLEEKLGLEAKIAAAQQEAGREPNSANSDGQADCAEQKGPENDRQEDDGDVHQ